MLSFSLNSILKINYFNFYRPPYICYGYLFSLIVFLLLICTFRFFSFIKCTFWLYLQVSEIAAQQNIWYPEIRFTEELTFFSGSWINRPWVKSKKKKKKKPINSKWFKSLLVQINHIKLKYLITAEMIRIGKLIHKSLVLKGAGWSMNL